MHGTEGAVSYKDRMKLVLDYIDDNVRESFNMDKLDSYTPINYYLCVEER